MKVKDLIELLNEAEDKEMDVLISFDMCMADDDIQGINEKQGFIMINGVN